MSSRWNERGLTDESPEPSATQLFRPRNRPPMAVLCVRFDEEDEGQEIAVFASPFVIGRVEGNLVIDHDSEISGCHAELIRVFDNGRYFWQLHDLKSTNGTFVRAAVALLRDQQEVLLGGRRYRFEIDGTDNDAGKKSSPATRKVQQAPLRTEQKPLASLVEIGETPDGTVFTQRCPNETASCGSVPMGRPHVSPGHRPWSQSPIQ